MARRRTRPRPSLVRGYIERIKRKALSQFRTEVVDLARGQHGVYALYKGKRLYYVGLAKDLSRRLRNHLGDRHASKWNEFSLYLVRREHHIREMEALLIRIADPSGNKQRGRLRDSKNLKPDLHNTIKKRALDELATILATKRRQGRGRGRVSRADEAQEALRKIRGKRIRGWRDGVEFKAYVTRAGWIRYRGYDYAQPTEVAKKALGAEKRVNGWAFWHFRRDGEDHRLRELK